MTRTTSDTPALRQHLLRLSRHRVLALAVCLVVLCAAVPFIVALPALYRLWAGRELTPLLRRTFAAGAVAVLGLAAATAWLEHPKRLLAPHLPEGAVRFLEAQGFRERVFNHQNFGGFLLWRRREPIFWDGRNDVFVSLVREVTTTPFPQVVEKYGVKALLIAEHDYEGIVPEIPERWGEAVRSWTELAERHRTDDLPDRNAEYLLLQTLVGAWPIGADRLDDGGHAVQPADTAIGFRQRGEID